jgi:hypothetical protein
MRNIRKRPVVPLKKALYGHPDSGTMWEQHCDKHVTSVGYKPMGEEWPSCYFHSALRLLLVVYVDDFDKGWEFLRKVPRKTLIKVGSSCVRDGLLNHPPLLVSTWDVDMKREL